MLGNRVLFHHSTLPAKYLLIRVETCPSANVLSRLDCGNATLTDIPAYLLQQLQLVVNASARLVYEIRPNQPVAQPSPLADGF